MKQPLFRRSVLAAVIALGTVLAACKEEPPPRHAKCPAQRGLQHNQRCGRTTSATYWHPSIEIYPGGSRDPACAHSPLP